MGKKVVYSIHERPILVKSLYDIVVRMNEGIDEGRAVKVRTLDWAVDKDADISEVQRKQLSNELSALIQTMLNYIENFVYLKVQFLYISLADRVISVERNGLYLDDRGDLLSI
jgi:hypothetical protein